MEAIRRIIRTKKNEVTLDIPNEFKNRNIEVIIIPSEEDETTNKMDFQRILESGPTFSNEEVDNVKIVGEKIKEI